MWSLLVHVYLRVTIFCGYKRLIFLQVGLKMQNFVPANVSYMHYRALEFIDLYHFGIQIAKFNTHKIRTRLG